MRSADLLTDAFERIRAEVAHVIEGLSTEQLVFRIDSDANSIAWLLWHLLRVQDDHVAAVAGTDQVWTSSSWADRFGLPLDVTDTGYNHTPQQVGAVTCDAELLRGYSESVHDATIRFVASVTDNELDRIVDERWDPPVTLGVRLVSVVADDLQHVGQAALVRGIVERK